MALEAGRLRHRVTLQARVDVQDAESGGITPTWSDLAGFVNVPAAVEPLSARELIAAASVQSRIEARITLRWKPGMEPTQRILHRVRNVTHVYDPAAFLPDKDSGLEYVTIPCSKNASQIESIPIVDTTEPEPEPPPVEQSETFTLTAGALTFNGTDYVGTDPVGFVTGTVFGAVDPSPLLSGLTVLECEANGPEGTTPPQTAFGFALQLIGGLDAPAADAFARLEWTGPDGPIVLDRLAADDPAGSAGGDARFWSWTIAANCFMDGNVYAVTLVY